MHWYGGEEEILEAELNVRDLLDEYVYDECEDQDYYTSSE
jgi:hypothetical protein